MRVTFSATFEYDAAPEGVGSILADESRLPQLVPGLEQLGRYWQYRGELYELRVRTVGARRTIEATCLASSQRVLAVGLTLENTGITTRLRVNAEAEAPLWKAWHVRGALAQTLARVHKVILHALGAPERRLAASSGSGKTPELELAARYPQTYAAFTQMNALDHLERVERLDRVWQAIRRVDWKPEHGIGEVYARVPLLLSPPGSPARFDLIYAGGGLGLLHAAVMAQRYGWRVLLFDRGEVGCAHREWNISRAELAALVEIGLFTWDELRDVVMNEYERGLVRFHKPAGTPTDLWLPSVLNVALDAGMLLQMARRKLEQAGGVVLDHRAFRRVEASDSSAVAVCVEVIAAHGAVERYQARLLLDGMGSISPLALERFAGQPFAGVCPTVGTVVSGLVEGEAANQHNRHVGDILLSIDDAQRGQQYMWEGFPGRGDELTVYLFYYDTLRKQHAASQKKSEGNETTFSSTSSPTLLQLFEDYFRLLPSYKQPGPEFRHVKPVYGYIPARHSLRRQEAPLLRGVLPVGDSAAQQSPLTFCGFGSHVRNLDRTTSLLNHALQQDLLEPQHLHAISSYQANVSLNWVFSRFMQPWGNASDVNGLQNIFLQVLNDLGIELAERFFQDRMRWGDYHKMVLGMFFRYPPIVQTAWKVLGSAGCRQWAADYVRYSGAALGAWYAKRLGTSGRASVAAAVGQVRPAWELRVRSFFAEWQASGWL